MLNYYLLIYPASKAIASIAFIQWAIEKVSLSIKRLFMFTVKVKKKVDFIPLLKMLEKD